MTSICSLTNADFSTVHNSGCDPFVANPTSISFRPEESGEIEYTQYVAATYYYDAFGNIAEQTGDVNNNITYAGYQYDKETGLYYLNARMYDPKIARFLQEDTYRGRISDPLSLNLYTYCHNEPIMYVDPTGHVAMDVYLNGKLVKGLNAEAEDGKTVVNVKEMARAFGGDATWNESDRSVSVTVGDITEVYSGDDIKGMTGKFRMGLRDFVDYFAPDYKVEWRKDTNRIDIEEKNFGDKTKDFISDTWEKVTGSYKETEVPKADKSSYRTTQNNQVVTKLPELPKLDKVQLGMQPSTEQIINYITQISNEKGLPVQIGLATAWTESNMTQYTQSGNVYSSNNPGSTDWGIMQINDSAWGDTFDFDKIKTDWQYNIRAGISIAKQSYDIAVKNNEGVKGKEVFGGTEEENLARATYSGYNAGAGTTWRYRTIKSEAPRTGPYDRLVDGYDSRDINFWNYYNSKPWEK